MLWRCFDGSEHPVSENFLAAVPREFSGVPYTRVEGERLSLLAKGDVREFVAKMHELPNATPDKRTAADLYRIRACDHVINVNRSLAMLDGRDYRSHNELFGPDGTLCQVHHGEWRPPCGCRFPFIFDHWLGVSGDPEQIAKIEVYPHHWQIYRCRTHAHGDYSDAFYQVRRANRAETYAAMTH